MNLNFAIIQKIFIRIITMLFISLSNFEIFISIYVVILSNYMGLVELIQNYW
jgi:hypothetical protein